MISLQYKLARPFVIEASYCGMALGEKAIVRPRFLSVCKADMRYFFGLRDAKVLQSRLPMALIHEACGEVLYDPSGEMEKGQKVVLLPNIPGEDGYYGENYRLDSLFRSSRADGFMQEMVSLGHESLVPYQPALPDEVLAFTEFISVGVHAVKGFDKAAGGRRGRVAVWGDGALSYTVCCVLKCRFPGTRVTVVGVNPAKLQYFTFVDEVLEAGRVEEAPAYDHVFECVGGNGSGNAIRQMVNTVMPEGVLMLLGVSEEPVPVSTRMVLEKGLTLIGRSRSAREDFLEAVRLLETDAVFLSRMRHLVSCRIEVKSINDISRAFELAKTADFKVVMDWNI